MLENTSPAIFTITNVVVSRHVTSFAEDLALIAFFCAVAMPLSASALDLNVEIRASVPFKNHIHAIPIHIALVAHSQ